MGKYINILDDLTINKIAAGEVVERPSSVVKELLENAIDSGATQVVVDITDGGKKCIKISDNGSGILSSEVEKCFLRHATSKIKEIDDLYDLYSFGFRGEALASISAVSNIEMITKTKEEVIGTKIELSGSKIIKKEPIGTKDGTTITIKDLFFNTPVRAKFLKSTHAETINISDLINKLAIGNTNVQFKYINNGKLMLNTPGDNKLISVIRSIYGKEIVENQRLEAVISMPSGVFKPYAGVSTAILIFTKTEHGGTDNVWFYDMQADGFSLDDKRSPIVDNDIPDIIARFRNRDAELDRKRIEKSFMVPKQEIVDNAYDLSINKYKEVEYVPVEYPPTSEIMANIREIEIEIGNEMEELARLLGE